MIIHRVPRMYRYIMYIYPGNYHIFCLHPPLVFIIKMLISRLLVPKTVMGPARVARANGTGRKAAWISAVKRCERWMPSKTARLCGAPVTADHFTIDAGVFNATAHESNMPCASGTSPETVTLSTFCAINPVAILAHPFSTLNLRVKCTKILMFYRI